MLFKCEILCKVHVVQLNLDHQDLNYPDFSIIQTFSPVSIFFHEYLLVMIEIHSFILFKITALKSTVKSEFVLLSKSKSSIRMCGN